MKNTMTDKVPLHKLIKHEALTLFDELGYSVSEKECISGIFYRHNIEAENLLGSCVSITRTYKYGKARFQVIECYVAGKQIFNRTMENDIDFLDVLSDALYLIKHEENRAEYME